MAILNRLLTTASPRKLLGFLCPSKSSRKVLCVLEGYLDRKACISFDSNVKTAVESCYGSVTTQMVFTSKRMLPVARKDILHTTQKSSVIYSCHSDSRYVGQTSQRLQDRIKQHVSKRLQQQSKRPTRSQPGRSCKEKPNNPNCDSAIGQHLLENEHCATNSDDRQFKFLPVAGNSFHLCLLAAAFIKIRHPVLCRQKEFVHTDDIALHSILLLTVETINALVFSVLRQLIAR